MKQAHARWISLAGTVASMVIIAALFALFAYKRRWIADDGLIYVRIVRHILDGNGPVFNAFERSEANTSALWPWLVALFSLFSYQHVEWVAVALGGVCSVAGLVLAMDGTRRWHRGRGYAGPLAPGAACIMLAVFPFWDFATSGLESGLCLLWNGCAWWLLVALAYEPSLRRQRIAAVVFGLAPLVRPDQGLAMVIFLIGGWLLIRPSPRRTIELLLLAFATPLAYEIFRAGFYGALVPLPALAKSAAAAEWSRGAAYLLNFLMPYRLWLPLLVLAACFVYVLRPSSASKTDRVLVVAPVLAGVLNVVYIVRVGGDFMHGRMWLSPMFMIAMPAVVLPVSRLLAPAIVVLVGWALVTYRATYDIRNHVVDAVIHDERRGYVGWTGDRHPIDERSFLQALGERAVAVQTYRLTGRRVLSSEGVGDFALGRHVQAPLAYVAGRLGSGGSLVSTREIVIDTLGLANPIGARITITIPDESPGHQKLLSWAWILADYSDERHDMDHSQWTPAPAIRAARHAMSCGDLSELIASVREPLTVGRFFRNLVGAVGRTRLVIPSDPVDAEWKFCGASARTPRVMASSSWEHSGWSAINLIDGETGSTGRAAGYTSALGNAEPHEEWIEVRYPVARTIAAVVLYPRNDTGMVGAGFPIDFTIESWDGVRWVPQHETRDAPVPTGPVRCALNVKTDRIRVRAQKLPIVGGDGRLFQLAEITTLP